MKKIMNKINFAIIAMMVSVPAFAAGAAGGGKDPMCELITKLQDVFKLFRTLAFVGAAFFIAGWAWDYISKAGAKEGGYSTEDIKKKGTGLLVGFILLFAIGFVLSFLLSASGGKLMGCSDEIIKGWA